MKKIKYYGKGILCLAVTGCLLSGCASVSLGSMGAIPTQPEDEIKLAVEAQTQLSEAEVLAEETSEQHKTVPEQLPETFMRSQEAVEQLPEQGIESQTMVERLQLQLSEQPLAEETSEQSVMMQLPTSVDISKDKGQPQSVVTQQMESVYLSEAKEQSQSVMAPLLTPTQPSLTLVECLSPKQPRPCECCLAFWKHTHPTPEEPNPEEPTPPTPVTPEGPNPEEPTPPRPITPEEPNPEEPTPPTPVTPEEPNPSTPEADAKKQKLNKVVANLKSGKNKNVITYETEDGEPRAVIWTMGINAPRMSDFRKDTTTPGHIIYSVGSQKGSRWFDVNKSKFVDSQSEFERSMCFAAVSANQLHWWLDQNAEYIQAYIAYKESQGYSFEKENPILNLKNHLNSYESQEKSGLYDMFKVYFGNKSTGFYTDLLNDFFINGYKPNASGGVNLPWKFERDYNGGFFYDVFGETQLTKRWGAGVYQDFKRDAIYLLKQGDVVGIVHESPTQGISHIVTMWGLEVDCDGEITALYISDSDDQYEPEVAMRKMFINRRRDAYARLTTNVQDANAGAKIIELSPLSLGTEQWEQYIQNIRE